MKTLKPYVTWIACALALLGAALMLRPQPAVRGFDLDAFARVPVLEGGRVKPIDSIARNSLLVIRGAQEFQQDGRTVGPDEWLLDVMFRPRVADAQPTFQIDDPDVLGILGLPLTTQRRYSFATIAPHIDAIEQQAEVASKLDAKQRTPFQSAVVNLSQRLWLYFTLKNTIQPEQSPGLLIEMAAATGSGAEQRQESLSRLAHFRPILPPDGASPDAWRTTGDALRAAAMGEQDPQLAGWARVGVAWQMQDAASFDRAVSDLRGRAQLAASRLPAVGQVEHEVVFNRAQPFYTGIVIYVLALLLVFVSWLRWGEVLRAAAYGLLIAGATVHTLGLVSRIVLQGRPPVTNLYSSAVFVGWGIVVLGVVLESMYKKGFGTAVAAACGVSSLIVAHHLSADGDTMEMMRAVLDSNFWLGTHVITITIGYAGTFLAGAIAIGWTIREHLVSAKDPDTSQGLSKAVYGIICFSVFFSFLGTVLGGIWADQSWGRFWGWDPKENGALLIVLWNAIILHARWGGYVKDRGIMAMAIFGNVITSLSWFGVNMLGVGLHSYGFMDKAFFALAGFDASQILLMGLALLPRQFWKPATERDEAAAEAG
jgi:ABC-type transport system involved in cytochrome c biogenesis permease subunit